MNDQLSRILNYRTKGEGIVHLEDEDFEYNERLKFACTVLLDYSHKTKVEQVQIIMDEYSLTSRATAYKLLADAVELFPAIEHVSKAFLRAQLTAKAMRFLQIAEADRETKGAAGLLKFISDINGLELTGDNNNGTVIINNVFKFDPKSLNVAIDANFDEEKFIQELEAEYEQRGDTN